jgi:antitoxin HicB
MERRVYEVVLSAEEDGGYSVSVPELPSVATQGETREEALEMAKEAIEGYLEAMRGDDLPIPAVEIRTSHRFGDGALD